MKKLPLLRVINIRKLKVFFKKTKKKIISFDFSLFFKKIKAGFLSFFKDLSFPFVTKAIRQNLPLFLAAIFLAPALFFGYMFIASRLYKKTPLAQTAYTGTIKVSRTSTTLSTGGD